MKGYIKATALLACSLAALLTGGWGEAHSATWWGGPVVTFFFLLALCLFLAGMCFLAGAVTEPKR